MKKYFLIEIVSLAVLTLLSSCNKIEKDEYRELHEQGTAQRTVLLEDYTGVGCVNCPVAAKEIERIKAVYGDNLIVVGMHPANKSLTLPQEEGDQNLQSKEAQTYAEYFKIESLPAGAINRKNVPEGGVVYSQWSAQVAQAISEEPVAAVSVVFSVDGGSYTMDVRGSMQKDYAETGNIGVIPMILEDSILVTQASALGELKGYAQNHVLRAVISADVWGDKVLDAKPSNGTTFAKSYSGTLNSVWVAKNLSAVAAVVNMESREVLTVGYAHLEVK